MPPDRSGGSDSDPEESTANGSEGPGRLALLFVTLTLALDAMGIGLILPVLPDLIETVQGRGLSSAALWGGVMATGFAVMQFAVSPLMGNLSDRYGRRPLLLVSLVVMSIHYLIMAVSMSPLVLLLARLLGGISAATQATATALLSDLSPDDKKAQNFGLIGAAFGVGFVLGPLLGGLLSEFGPRTPFYFAALLAALNCMLGYFVLPETVTVANRRAFEWKRANPFGAFRHMSALPGMGRFLVFSFVYEFAFVVYPAIWAFFTKARFGWSAAMTGVSLAAFGVSMAIVQGILIRWLVPRFGEWKLIWFGLVFNIVAFAILSFISNGRVALAFIPLTAFGAVVMPALQAIMARRAGPTRQGELQGALAAARAIAMVLSPIIMTQIFFIFTTPPGPELPGAPFLLSMALMCVCVFLMLRVPKSEG